MSALINKLVTTFTISATLLLVLSPTLYAQSIYEKLQYPLYDDKVAPATDCGVDTTPGYTGDGTLDRLMKAIAQHESGGNPKAYNSGGPAYGKYQYITDTWQGALKAYYPPGISKYPNASDAPVEVQDAVTYYRFAALANKYGGSVFKIAVVQYYPAALTDPSLMDTVPNSQYNSQTPRQFGNQMVDWYNNGDGSEIKLFYNDLRDFQQWLSKNGLQKYPPLYATKDDVGEVNKMPVTQLPTTATSPECDANGIVDPSGYTFPLGPQKQSSIGNLPCENKLIYQGQLVTTCHHDQPPASDITSVKNGGSPVYAISDGKIGVVNKSYSMAGYPEVPGCTSINLESSLDGYKYWYGHLQNPLVKEGDFVKSGQKIAEVSGFGGTACYGGGPHLHVDRGCVRNGVKQPGGYDDCRDAELVLLINELYLALPK